MAAGSSPALWSPGGSRRPVDEAAPVLSRSAGSDSALQTERFEPTGAGAFAAGAFTRMILRYLPVVLLVRRVLSQFGRGQYRLIEDTYLPPAFLELLGRFRLPLEPEGHFFLRDRRPLRAGVIVEREAGGVRHPRDARIKSELRAIMDQAGRSRRQYALLSFSPKMYDRYGFSGERPCFLVVWTADRQPLEYMLKKRQDQRFLKDWKRNLLESPLAPRRHLEHVNNREAPRALDWERWNDLAYRHCGTVNGELYQKLSVQADDERFRMTLTAGVARDADELADRVRRWKDNDNGADLSVCSMELAQGGRLRLWLDDFTPIIWRARERELFAATLEGEGETRMKQIRGRLWSGDRILLAAGPFEESDRRELHELFTLPRDEFATRIAEWCDLRGHGRGLVFEFRS